MAVGRTDGVRNSVRKALKAMDRTLSGRAWSLGLATATVVVTALTIWLALGLGEQRQADQRRQDILAAARQSALNFTSLDYRHYDRDSANVLAGATGDFKKQFAAQTEQLTELVAQNRSVSEGQILEAGIVRSDENAARVLVVADSKVTNTAVPQGRRAPTACNWTWCTGTAAG